jgi:hypothetical protein
LPPLLPRQYLILPRVRAFLAEISVPQPRQGNWTWAEIEMVGLKLSR